MEKATIRDIDVKGRRVFVRVDYNVPLKEGAIRDDTRIQESLPTIKYLIEHGAIIVLASHLGRPEGQVVESMSLKPVAERLSQLLGKEVKMMKDCIGEEVENAVMAMKSGEVALLENLRFHKQETKNDKEFSAKLAKLGEIYVDDAFGTAHRAHASTYGVAELLPAVSGFLLEKELKFLGKLLHNPEKPYVAILGGAKVSDKIDVIRNLLKSVDTLLIGGAMAFTFLKIQGYEVGKSRVEPEKEEEARKILEDATLHNVTIEFPVDLVVAGEMKEGVPHKVVALKDMPSDMMGLDIGPGTVELFKKHLVGAKTVFWNGPMGVFEIEDFASGTLEVAKILAGTSALICVGGGDSVAAVKQLGFGDKMTHLSTGGGASLELLEGKELPGVVILKDRTTVRAG